MLYLNIKMAIYQIDMYQNLDILRNFAKYLTFGRFFFIYYYIIIFKIIEIYFVYVL